MAARKAPKRPRKPPSYLDLDVELLAIAAELQKLSEALTKTLRGRR